MGVEPGSGQTNQSRSSSNKGIIIISDLSIKHPANLLNFQDPVFFYACEVYIYNIHAIVLYLHQQVFWGYIEPSKDRIFDCLDCLHDFKNSNLN